MRALLAIATALNLLAALCYAVVAVRLYRKAYEQGRKDADLWWIEVDAAAELQREKMWREES